MTKAYGDHNGKNPPRHSRKDQEPAQRAHRRAQRGDSAPADWGTVDAAKLLAVIAAVTRHGYAITLGYTRDGGAYTINVLGDTAFEREYVRPTEDMELYLEGLLQDYST